MRTLLAMAWRNVFRNRRRSLLTAGAMAIAVCVCMWMMAFQAGLFGAMEEVLITETTGHVQIHHEDYPGPRNVFDTLDRADALVAELAEAPGVERMAVRMYGSALVGGDERTEGARLIGVDPGREEAFRELSSKIETGRWLGDTPAQDIVLGVDLAEQLEADVGQEVVLLTQAADGSLGNALYTVRGLVETGSPSVDRAGAYVHRLDLGDLLALPDQVHEIVLVGDDTSEATAAALAEVARDVGGSRPLVVRTWRQVDPVTAQLVGMQAFSGLILVSFFFSVSAVGVINTLLMSVFERTREFGVMRAIGMQPREVVVLVVCEALVLAVGAVAFGGLLGALVDVYLVNVGIDMSVGGAGYEMGDMTFDPVVKAIVTPESVWQPVVGVFVFSVLAAVWPAVRAARLSPVDAMREA